MRKIITVFIATLLIYSCDAYKSVTDSTYLGMTKKEFIQEVKYPTLEMAYEGVEVYKKTKRVVRGGIAIFVNVVCLFIFSIVILANEFL